MTRLRTYLILPPGPARRATLAVFVVAQLVVLLVTWRFVVEQRADAKLRLDDLAVDAAARVEGRLDLVEQTLWSLAADAAVHGLDLDDFTEVVQGGRLVDRTVGAQSLSVARELPAPGPDRPVGGGTELIVERIVPLPLGEGVTGQLDLYGEEERRRATQTARDLGLASATAPLELAYGGLGVLHYVPVYEGDPQTGPERRRAFLGVVIAVVDPIELLDGVLGPRPLLDVHVEDLGPVDQALLGQPPSPVVATTVWGSPVDAGPTGRVDLAVGDRRWGLSAAPTTVLAEDAASMPLMLATGSVLSLLLAGLVGSVLGARQRAEHIAAERTRQLQAAYERLVVADRLRSQFVTTVSHELRTPLTSVLGFVQTLQRLGPDAGDRMPDFLERIERNALLLRRMIEELLDFGRMERGELQLHPEPRDLGVEVPRIVGDLVAGLGGRTVDVTTSTDTWVMVDGSALERVLSNLLSNAVRYADGDHPIEVEVRADGAQSVLSVADRGPGIADVDLPMVFERFYRGTGVMGEGTGIGLSMVRGLVEAHGGSTSLRNRPGGGALATVRLPLAGRPRGSDAGGAATSSVRLGGPCPDGHAPPMPVGTVVAVDRT